MPPVDGSDVGSQAQRLLRHLPQFKATLRPPFTSFLRALAPYTKFRTFRTLGLLAELLEVDDFEADASHPVVRGIKLFLNRAIAHLLTFHDKTAAMVRTTIAVTGLKAGVADNVLPQTGSILFNLRSHPDEVSLDLIKNHFLSVMSLHNVQGSIGRLNRSDGCEVTRVASHEGHYYKILSSVIREIWSPEDPEKQLIIAPSLCTGETDSKHFARLSRQGVLRFVPVKLSIRNGDDRLVHGTNERTRVEYYLRAICFFERLIELTAF
jgi:acetylornithine deacetylase/succinyl-diaminopimelate desuccinylase-like protein